MSPLLCGCQALGCCMFCASLVRTYGGFSGDDDDEMGLCEGGGVSE